MSIEKPGELETVDWTSTPRTALFDMFLDLQKEASKNLDMGKISPYQHVCMLLKETSDTDVNEVMKFVAGYITKGPEEACNGMFIMFLLGYMYARGATTNKKRIVVPK